MRPLRIAVVAVVVVVAGGSGAESRQAPTPDAALGKWQSVEQFEGEPKLSFAFKRTNGDITGWAVLLGQKRKGNDHTVLMLTFNGVKWDKDRLKFDTFLPEGEDVIGWELRPASATRATLLSLTINGVPIDDDDLVWEMVR